MSWRGSEARRAMWKNQLCEATTSRTANGDPLLGRQTEQSKMNERPLIHPSATDSFTDCFPPFLFGVVQWASRPIVPATSAGSRRTGFERVWKPSGVVKYSAADERRDASVSPSDSRANTPGP